MKRFDVTAIGELLIDFTPAGKSPKGMDLFECNPGGAPANVLATVNKLGGKTAFIGKVGNDGFGKFLTKTLLDLEIDVSGLVIDKNIPTTLAFVQLDEKGDRSFSFYRKPGADMMLCSSEVKNDLVSDCEIFHFGSVSLTDNPAAESTLRAAKAAKEAGAIISYDPNYRPLLWDSVTLAKERMTEGLKIADIVKVSDEEMKLLTGEDDLTSGAKAIMEYGASLVFVSLGAKGSFYFNNKTSNYLSTYDVKTIDTTGAGDAFLGAILYKLTGKTLDTIKALDKAELDDILDFANASGSLTTTRTGAASAIPTLEEIEACRKNIEYINR